MARPSHRPTEISRRPVRDDVQGFPGAAQVAAVCGEKRDGGEFFPPAERLLTSAFIEKRVLLPDVALHVILPGITVTQQIDDTFSVSSFFAVHQPHIAVLEKIVFRQNFVQGTSQNLFQPNFYFQRILQADCNSMMNLRGSGC